MSDAKGVYGVETPSHKTVCPNSNNPFGHSSECACQEQVKPVMPACPYYTCTLDDHSDCWDKYDLWESARKYRS